MNAPQQRLKWVRSALQHARCYLLLAALIFGCFHLSKSYAVLSGWLTGHEAWLWLAMLATAVGGTLLMLRARRFWAWPYAYLIALWLAPATPTQDYVDLGMLIANAVLLMFSIALAESLGLSLGRWFSRVFATGYFAAAGLSLAVLAIVQLTKDSGWQVWFLIVCGVLYWFQAWLQYCKLKQLRQDEQDFLPDRPPPPKPIVGAEHLPWSVRVDGLVEGGCDPLVSEQSAGEKDQNGVS